MRLLGKTFLIKIDGNPLNNKVIKIIENDVKTGYVHYIELGDETYKVYDGKIYHIQYRIENKLWIPVKVKGDK